jgi:hypothetical protein
MRETPNSQLPTPNAVAVAAESWSSGADMRGKWNRRGEVFVLWAAPLFGLTLFAIFSAGACLFRAR